MSDAKVKRALRIFEDFTGAGCKVLGAVEVPADDVMVTIGNVEAIAYNTIRDGKRQSYQHEFKPSSRPVLAVSHDGRRLYLLAGAYRFTDRGIEDR